MQAILIAVELLVAVGLIVTVLLQRSEGGALGMGGGPSGFMSTRGVGDLLTRTTGILAAAFFILCLSLTLLIGRAHRGDAVVDRLKIQGLDPSALASKPAQAPPPSANVPAPAVNPNAPILEAPKPEVHTAPAAPAAAPILAPAPPPAILVKPAEAPAAKKPAEPTAH